MKRDFTITIELNGVTDQIVVRCVDCHMLNNSMVMIDDVTLDFNHTFVIRVERGCKA